jgi:hypothetical protein
VRLHQLGHDLVLAYELGFEMLDLLVLGILDCFGRATVLKTDVAVFEELFLPVVEDRGRDAELIAEGGGGDAFEQMPLEARYLLLGVR